MFRTSEFTFAKLTWSSRVRKESAFAREYAVERPLSHWGGGCDMIRQPVPEVQEWGQVVDIEASADSGTSSHQVVDIEASADSGTSRRADQSRQRGGNEGNRCGSRSPVRRCGVCTCRGRHGAFQQGDAWRTLPLQVREWLVH